MILRSKLTKIDMRMFLTDVKKQKVSQKFQEMHRPDAELKMILRSKLTKIDMRMFLTDVKKQKVL